MGEAPQRLETGSELQALDLHMGLSRTRPTRGYGRLGPHTSTRLLFLAEEQGRGISPAACRPPRCPLPSPAPTTNHLLRRSQPRRPPLATGQVGARCPGRTRVLSMGWTEEDGEQRSAGADHREKFTSPPEGRINGMAENSRWKPTHSEHSLCHLSAQSPQPWGFPMASKCHPGTPL